MEFMKPPAMMIPLKQWAYEEAQRIGKSDRTVWYLLKHGGYPHIKLKRVNARVIFVLNPQADSHNLGSHQRPA
jgi:hypothetical protein